MDGRRRILFGGGRGEEAVELFLAVDPMRVMVAIAAGAFEQSILDRLQRSGDIRDELCACDALLFLVRLLAAADEHGIFFHVARTDFQAHGYAFLDPAPHFLAAAFVTFVDDDADRTIRVALCAQFLSDAIAIFEHAGLLIVGAEDRDDHDLRRRHPRRQDQTVVVRVGHDQTADQTRGHTPARRPGVLTRAALIQEHDLAGFREVLAEEMTRARLQRLAVLHHGFDGVRSLRTREALARRLLALDDR